MSGGAWKVAYADFVTAMMALFMVLWISSQDKKILIATSRYFQSPFRSPLEDHSGIMPFNKQQSVGTKSSEDASGANKPSASLRQVELSFLNTVAADFARMLNLDVDKEKKPLDVQVTSDGLRITLFDRASRPLFVGDTTEFTAWGKFVLQNLAWTVDRHRFRVIIDGHTRSGVVMPREDYSTWELSSDRANAARRDLVRYAVDPKLIERVTGFSDTRPMPGEPRESESNHRLTLSLTLTSKPPATAPAPPAATAVAKPAEVGARLATPAPAAAVAAHTPPP